MSGSIKYEIFKIFNFIIYLLFIINGFLNIPTVTGEVTIGTIIETTGMVHDAFIGSWNSANGNGTNISGTYSDSETTNGGNFSLNKYVQIDDSNLSSMDIRSQKVLKYSSEESGGHLIADEYLNTRSKVISYSDEFPWNCSYRVDDQTSSFTITNAKEIKLSSIARYEDYTQEYTMAIGTEDKNSSEPGLIGNLHTKFSQESETDLGKVSLYDRSYVSGLIENFNRIYHGGEEVNLIGTSSVEGFFTDKTIADLARSSNTSENGIINGTAIYLSDIMANGGNSQETKQIQVTDGISSDRIVTYQSDGSKSIQAYEELIATQERDKVINNNSIICVFSVDNESPSLQAPYMISKAETHFAGVSSAQIESSGRILDPTDPEGLNLGYRADMQIPIGFNYKIVSTMRDPDNDGKFEDLNGNGRLDLNDLVLLFSNFRWISESNISERIDYNNNNKADYADIVTLFKRFNLTKSEGLVNKSSV
jgi:hypothetical protein